MKTIKQYLLYVPTEKGKEHKERGNWRIEKYDIWDDLQGRVMVFEMRGQETKTVIEYTDGTKEEDSIIF